MYEVDIYGTTIQFKDKEQFERVTEEVFDEIRYAIDHMTIEGGRLILPERSKFNNEEVGERRDNERK